MAQLYCFPLFALPNNAVPSQTPRLLLYDGFLEVQLLSQKILCWRFLMEFAKLPFLNVVLIHRPTDPVGECLFCNHWVDNNNTHSQTLSTWQVNETFLYSTPWRDPTGKLKTVPWEYILWGDSWCFHESLLKPSTSSNIYLTPTVC